MKKRKLKMAMCSVMSLMMFTSGVHPVQATEEPGWKNGIKDHWSFEAGATTSGNQTTVASDEGEKSSGVLNGITIEDTGNAVFGKALKFGDGVDKYMGLEDYINTGTGSTSFSMWYKYDTSITEEDAKTSAILLQHEDKNGKTGRTVLSLSADGKYDTFLNAKEAPTEQSVVKGDWQHITVVFDQSAKKVKYYINGELEGTEKNLGSTVTDEKLPLRVGAHKNKGSKDPHPMRGFVDEFYVYNRALDAEEAKSLYADKAAALYKVDLNAFIKEAEDLLKSTGLPEDNALRVQLQEAVAEAKKVAETDAPDMETLKSTKEALKQAVENYKAEQPIDLRINANEVTQNIDADSIFGINHRYAFNGYGTFDSEKMQMKKEFADLYKDAGFGSIRYPGGTISNLFNWKTTLGPKEQRKKQIHGFYNNPGQGGIAPNFGIGEIATFADEVDSEIVYVYSLGQGSVQDAADLVEYLNAKVGTNPNGGIDWAQVRADNGHEAPYNVRYFEIGNEMNQGGTDGTTSQQYWTAYVEGGAENAYIDGGTATFNKKYAVKEGDWNKVASQSDGTPNQVRYLRYANVNPGKLNDGGKIIVDSDFKAMEDQIEVWVGNDKNNVQWKIVDDLKKHGSDERVCEVDYATGAIKFGDNVNGKIPETGNNIYVTYSVKRDGFINISKAIKETTDQINAKENTNHVANVYTSFESTTFFGKMESRKAENLYDGMTIHPYSDSVSGGGNSDTFYDNAMKHAEDRGVGKVTHMMEHMPKGKVPVISEYGIFRNTETQLRSQTHAIYIAKVLMEYVRLGSPYIQKHCLTDWYSSGADSLGPTQQAVIQVAGGTDEERKTGESKNFTFFSTPSAHVFKMLNSGFGDNIVKTEFSEVPTMANGVKTLSALASKDAQGNLYIALVNADREKDRNIALQIEGADVAGSKMTIQKLETDSITAENTPENPTAVQVTEDAEVTLTGNPVVNLKKHSFAIVRIGKAVEPEADKTELQAAVDAVDDLVKEHYENFNVIEEALAAANAVLKNAEATQEQINSALDALEAAKAKLVMKAADYSKVDAAIEKAGKLNKDDYKDFSKVEEAIAAVVRDKKVNEQAEVDAMAKKIEDAIKALEKKQPNEPTTPNKSDLNGGEKSDNGKQNDSVKTGDTFMILPMLLLAVTSGILCLIVERKRRRS